MASKRGRSAASPTVRSNPDLADGLAARDAVTAKHAALGQKAAKARPYNRDKSSEFGDVASTAVGEHVDVNKADTIGSLSEVNDTGKTGGSKDRDDAAAPVGVLARDRVTAAATPLTTNQGVAIGSNQGSLTAGTRGPTSIADFILREKITHFDHERIPERVVHARGSAAHGYFECTAALPNITSAAVFAKKGLRTPVFVRFSTVAGERGSTDTARDVRGFAVKFYSTAGNWDLVGNNIPVFFIQDAMKFPDLVHAVKPEPHNAIPQAASAHDTFWDFVSLMPESTHMLFWVMSDRAIPRSLRMMQGFGVHTFRFVNDKGESTFCKFHWRPAAGVHSLVWDEAVKISGADSDFHRRDLWEAIEAGAYPSWTLGVQLFTEEESSEWSFDVLDATKLVPEELVPIREVGRMVLNRNPDNFFAETEQVAFCTANVIPGIDFSNDPLLSGRHHSYLDTQLSRLGGPNFHEIPINAPLAGVANNQRDGIHRQAVHRGNVAYEPNSLAGGCPFQAGVKGFVPFPAIVETGPMTRGKPEKFAEHYLQAQLFYRSLTPPEQQHVEAAFRFELSKLNVPAIRSRMVAGLRNVDERLAARLATALGIDLPDALPRAVEFTPEPEVAESAALSQRSYPGDKSIATRKIAFLLADGVVADGIQEIATSLGVKGAVSKFIAPSLKTVAAKHGTVPIDATYESSPSVLFDAVILPGDEHSIRILNGIAAVQDFIRDQYKHCKTIGVLGADTSAVTKYGVAADPKRMAGIVKIAKGDIEAFVNALGAHRHYEREAGPANKTVAMAF